MEDTICITISNLGLYHLHFKFTQLNGKENEDLNVGKVTYFQSIP